MDGLIPLLFIVGFFILVNKSKKKKPVQKKGRQLSPRTPMNSEQEWSARLQKAQNAGRSVTSGQTTLERYKQVQKKRYKEQLKANHGLWQSKHRIDKNKNRRSDWGSRGDRLQLSPAMIGIIGGGVLTVYLGITALNG